MAVLGIDLGATKVAAALFNEEGEILSRKQSYLEGRKGAEAGELVAATALSFFEQSDIKGIGVCVPGIVYSKRNTVWCPNIPGWEDFPLKETIEKVCPNVPVHIESDRTCYILGEKWKGVAKDCDNAIYIAVGSGIGAGILLDGKIIHGSNDIVGATGWMALESDYDKDWDECGCFETFASGNGIAYQASKLFGREISSPEVFSLYESNDSRAVRVIEKAIQMWGKGAANLVSLFDPEMIVFGGGVFSGPAKKLIPRIYREALKWGQPISMKNVKFLPSGISSDAALLGAGYSVLY